MQPSQEVHAVIRIDEPKRQVTVKGRAVSLTPTEYRLLAALMSRTAEPLSRKELASLAMGDSVVGDRTIDVHVASLRRKLGTAGQQIEAVRGIGYRFATATAVSERCRAGTGIIGPNN